ncbi:PREDICTED: uncharacterized protein LOC103342412 isoform X1 [Prunus mume]|uniref:Uncharacterized protein LOC103342412 isoform X1 n=1 Tax=Prunus mume TaxID=102107 RepID=A0ABM0PTJ2_PRUMU|nr:PREDICTED: uncharacterized protein LOC103342412 isoform X1 [Prunus mume]
MRTADRKYIIWSNRRTQTFLLCYRYPVSSPNSRAFLSSRPIRSFPMAQAPHPICKLLIYAGISAMSYKIYTLKNEATTLMLEADRNIDEFDRTNDNFTTVYIIDAYREWREKQTLLDTIASTRRFICGKQCASVTGFDGGRDCWVEKRCSMLQLRSTCRKEREKGKSSPFHHRKMKSRPAVVSSACKILMAISDPCSILDTRSKEYRFYHERMIGFWSNPVKKV